MTSADAHHREITSTILAAYPQTQAVYLFGSFDTEEESPVSDVDIAILLPHAEAGQVGSLSMSDLRFHFEMLTLSFYQKLNEERRDILEQFYQTGRAYDV